MRPRTIVDATMLGIAEYDARVLAEHHAGRHDSQPTDDCYECRHNRRIAAPTMRQHYDPAIDALYDAMLATEEYQAWRRASAALVATYDRTTDPATIDRARRRLAAAFKAHYLTDAYRNYARASRHLLTQSVY